MELTEPEKKQLLENELRRTKADIYTLTIRAGAMRAAGYGDEQIKPLVDDMTKFQRMADYLVGQIPANV